MVQLTRVLSTLRDGIDEGRYPQYARLPAERDLATELGVGRSTLRKALGLLEAEGRIWRHVGRGTFVGGRPMTRSEDLSTIAGRTNPEEIMEARLHLEPRNAALAALRASNDDLQHLDTCLTKGARAGDVREHELWDGTFHRAIACATKNQLLIALFDAVNAVRTQGYWGEMRRARLGVERCRITIREHRVILQAIADRDSARAEMAMARHIESVRSSMRSPARPRARTPQPEEV